MKEITNTLEKNSYANPISRWPYVNSFYSTLVLYVILNFLAKKVLEYQKKKLSEAEERLSYHLSRKKDLENMTMKNITKEIQNEEKMIQIWNNNIEKIKSEIKKIQEN